jgi:UDPglucose 6-dehydrogenase
MGGSEVAIVGYGTVGKHMEQLLVCAQKSYCVYDKLLGIGSRDEVNSCAIAFICVPTNACEDGSCDLSAVEDVLSWLDGPLAVIRSTVPVGTTRALRQKLARPIVFNPEYVGETPWAPQNPERSFVLIGGDPAERAVLLCFYESILGSIPRYGLAEAEAVELAKYMENAFLATKVTFCNEFAAIAQALGVEYEIARELWLLDERMGRHHTAVTQVGGYGGRCLPKDMSAVISQSRAAGYDPGLLVAVSERNAFIRAGRESDTISEGRVDERPVVRAD